MDNLLCVSEKTEKVKAYLQHKHTHNLKHTQHNTSQNLKKREAPDRHTHLLWQIQDQQEPTNTYTKLRWGLLVVIEGINYEWIEPIIINYLLIASTLLSCYHCMCARTIWVVILIGPQLQVVQVGNLLQ